MNNATSDNDQNSTPPVLIVLCGLVGSGKSTFASALQREFPEFLRCNQDELGRRADVEREVHASLSRGLSVCVDRTNIDPGQRRTWIDIAHQYPGVEIWGVQMDTPYETCRERLAERREHPTIKTPEQALYVLTRFAKDLVPIDASEGFNRVFSLLPYPSPDFTREELEDILASIRATSLLDTPPPPAPAPTFTPPHSRGHSSHPNRGRGRGYNQNQSWRSPPSAASPHSVGGTDPTLGAWKPAPDRGGWRTQEGRGRSFRGDGRGAYRGTQQRGRSGGNYAPHTHKGPPRAGQPLNRGRGSLPYTRGGPLDPTRGGAMRSFRGGFSTAGNSLEIDNADTSISHPHNLPSASSSIDIDPSAPSLT